MWAIQRADGMRWSRLFPSEDIARRYARRFIRDAEIEFRELPLPPRDDARSNVVVLDERAFD